MAAPWKRMPSNRACANCSLVLRQISLEAKTLCAIGRYCPKYDLAPLRYFQCDAPSFRQDDAKMTVALENAQLCVLRGKNDRLPISDKLALSLRCASTSQTENTLCLPSFHVELQPKAGHYFRESVCDIHYPVAQLSRRVM